MQITYYGHSCFLVETGGKKVLFDPFITPNVLAKSVDVDTLKPDFILLSHGHQDHIADVERIYQNSKAFLVSNFEICTWFNKKGVENYHPMNMGGSMEWSWGSVKMVSAIHSSSFPDGSYAGNPSGFVVQSEGKTFYYAGDTALTLDMKLIAEEFKIDFAFMPIGDNFTMGIKDALKAADFVGTKKIFGMHYDTFPYIKIEQNDVHEVAAKAGKELKLFEIGETITI
ncbi:metal-dependent hydrolase [Cesiribacter sp. SM1]|uniref:metal-dependent hydrolase n=1 Tax=Cesiribacter sp. SM1 TaxID=2861196 RepID=UPI001CD44624|nr:metal-dependent hydrolase [Cesiribacter sp. SM1]